jgi:hypothetical protein
VLVDDVDKLSSSNKLELSTITAAEQKNNIHDTEEPAINLNADILLTEYLSSPGEGTRGICQCTQVSSLELLPRVLNVEIDIS